MNGKQGFKREEQLNTIQVIIKKKSVLNVSKLKSIQNTFLSLHSVGNVGI